MEHNLPQQDPLLYFVMLLFRKHYLYPSSVKMTGSKETEKEKNSDLLIEVDLEMSSISVIMGALLKSAHKCF